MISFMSTWTIVMHTVHDTRNIIGAAHDTSAARAAALRGAHALIDNATAGAQYELHVDQNLIAVVSASDPTPHSRDAAHALLNRLDHVIDPYSY